MSATSGEGEPAMDTEEASVLVRADETDEGIAIPHQLLPEDARRDGRFRVIASVDRLGLLGGCF